MKLIELEQSDEIATIRLAREKVNALTGSLIDELYGVLKELEHDQSEEASNRDSYLYGYRYCL